MITEVRSSLGELSDAWDDLVVASPVPSPFLRSWWLEACAAGEPRFVLVTENGKLLGGLALEEDRRLGVPRVRELGANLGADHVDLVATPERAAEVAGALAEWFAGQPQLLVDIVGCTADARLADVLPGRVRRDDLGDAPYELLPSTLDEYFAERSRAFRRNIARPRKRLADAGVQHDVAGPAECLSVLEELWRLHDAQFGSGSEFAHAFDRFARAAPAGIEREELVIHRLAVDGRAIAIDVCFEVAGRLSYYQGGRDDDREWRGSGTVLMYLSLKHGHQHGCREFDLLRGGEPYKASWATRTRRIVRLSSEVGVRARGISAASRLKRGFSR